MEYILSIGTNIGDRKENIENCINALNLIPYTDVVRQSSIYETEPVGYARQENFYNILILVESILEPNEMLGACLGIEGGMGRKRTFRNGPRVIDVDVILAENCEIKTRNLIVPHPRYRERRFVLEPLLELFPDGNAFGIEFKTALDSLTDQEVIKL